MLAYAILSHSDATMASKSTSGKPQIIKFTSTMCLDCQKLNGVMKQVYPKYSDKLTLVEIHVQENTDFNKEMIKKYNVTLVPTMVFINSKGNKKARTEGFMNKSQLEKRMKDLIND